MTEYAHNPYQPDEVVIIERTEESPDLFTLRLEFSDPDVKQRYEFDPGQFNMVYLYGVAMGRQTVDQHCQRPRDRKSEPSND